MEFADRDKASGEALETQNIEWLRERGVQIDIPSSKDNQPSNEVNHALDRVIIIVKIPADTKIPYEEVQITINDGIAGDQLISLLKPNFIGTGTESISNSALQKATESLLKSNSSTNAGTGPDVSILDRSPDVQKSTLLNMFENQGHVEAFNLTRPSESNNWRSVAFYLDEGGQLKGLPSNPRASSIAAECGYEGVNLAGDVFIARRFQEGAIRHVSFRLDELGSSAEWMKTAHRDNYALGAATGQVSMDSSTGMDKGVHVDPRKGYEWNQDEDTVDVCFTLPTEHKDVSKKFLSVKIFPEKLVVTRLADAGVVDEAVCLLDLRLYAGIRVSDSTWSRSGDCVEFGLEKVKEEDWAQLEAA